jgi:hypothetical protein
VLEVSARACRVVPSWSQPEDGRIRPDWLSRACQSRGTLNLVGTAVTGAWALVFWRAPGTFPEFVMRWENSMAHSPAWDEVAYADVLRAIQEYDRLGPEQFFSEHGFAPTTTYELIWDGRPYPPKAILGTAFELATGQRLASGDFEGGKTGAVKVLGKLGFTVQQKSQPT